MKKYKEYVNDLINPFKSFKRFPWNVIDFPRSLWFWLREKWFNFRYGFHPCEIWNFETSIAVWILPRLKYFRKVNNSVPNEIVQKYGKGDVDKAGLKWDEFIDSMINAFEIIADDNIDLDYPEFKKQKKEVDKGLKLFAEYFENLWW